MEDSEVISGVMFLFDKFLGNHLNYTRPIKLATTKWFNKPHVRGSYSFRSLSTDAFNVTAKDLGSPIFDDGGVPRLLFAGEATHSGFYSTAHGAVESGYREAQRIMDYHE
jgi:spermine oxidase